MDIDFEHIDKVRFFGVGTGSFLGLTVVLYPLWTVKTHNQVSGVGSGGSGPEGARAVQEGGFLRTVRSIVRERGPLGLWRGLGTVVVAEVPIQIVYVSTLEAARQAARRALIAYGASPQQQAAGASAAGGGAACLAIQSLVVPTDVVSQRQMVSAADRKESGWAVARRIVATDGLRGLYRGLPVSCLQSVPQHTVWWTTYGSARHALAAVLPNGNTVAAGVTAGVVTAVATQPADVVKTRLQVLGAAGDSGVSAARRQFAELLRTDGVRGLYRGLGPRSVQQATWGTVMVNLYEWLKRTSAIQPPV